MRPRDRVTLLRRLADTLEQYGDWEELDLVLRQFGFATPYSWEGTKRSCALRQLEGGTDTALVDLDEYLNGGEARANLDPGDLPWEPGTFRLFLSHTNDKARVAGEMRRVLASWRVDAFVAHATIEPTREWMNVIEAALASLRRHGRTANSQLRRKLVVRSGGRLLRRPKCPDRASEAANRSARLHQSVSGGFGRPARFRPRRLLTRCSVY